MDQEKRIAYLVKNDWSTAPVPTEYRAVIMALLPHWWDKSSRCPAFTSVPEW